MTAASQLAYYYYTHREGENDGLKIRWSLFSPLLSLSPPI